jgi:hypothetical protein
MFASNSDINGTSNSVDSAYNVIDDPPGIQAALSSQCKNQKIRSTRQVQSFYILGLGIVFGSAGFSCVLVFFLSRCMSLVGRIVFSKQVAENREISQQMDDKLELLRVAVDSQQGVEGTKWAKGLLDVPIMTSGIEFKRPHEGPDGFPTY